MIIEYKCIYRKFKCTKVEYSKGYKYVSMYYDI